MSRVAILLLAAALLAEPVAAQLRPANSGKFASADSAATTYSNPAGLTRLDRPELVLGTLVAYSRSKFEVANGTTVAGGDGDLKENFITIPSLYFATPALHERLRFGFSLNVPSGIGSDYGDEWAGRYVTTESSLVYVAINGSVAVRVNDWLSLGGGLQILYTESKSESKINNFLESLPDGNVRLEASGIGVGGVVSTLIELDELLDFEELIGHDVKARIGLAYRPKTETDIDGVPELEGIGPVLGAALIANGLVAQKVDLETTSPQSVGLGLYVEPIERLSIAIDFLWIDMEQFGDVSVSVSEISISSESDYRDTYATTFSLGWDLTSDLELLAGFAYLSSPIADSKRSLSLPIDRVYVVGVGAKYRVRDWLEIFGAFNYYDTGDSRVDTTPTSRSGRIVGESSPHFALGLDLGLTFRF